eukprot:scaffold284112_cov28-Tisochrysis_lutea.AAC.1
MASDPTRAALAFLSESRLQLAAERSAALPCASAVCAYLCTGLSAAHCCRLCARQPGEHGPQCERRLTQCAGCEYAVSGLVPAFCCRKCERDPGNHGPHCLRIVVGGVPEGDTEEYEEEEPKEERPLIAVGKGLAAGGAACAPAAEASSSSEAADPYLSAAQRTLELAQQHLGGTVSDEEDVDPDRPPDPALDVIIQHNAIIIREQQTAIDELRARLRALEGA